MSNKTLTKWWLFTVITGIGFVALAGMGVFKDIYHADVTGISFVI